jgi:hypothetical protein
MSIEWFMPRLSPERSQRWSGLRRDEAPSTSLRNSWEIQAPLMQSMKFVLGSIIRGSPVRHHRVGAGEVWTPGGGACAALVLPVATFLARIASQAHRVLVLSKKSLIWHNHVYYVGRQGHTDLTHSARRRSRNIMNQKLSAHALTRKTHPERRPSIYRGANGAKKITVQDATDLQQSFTNNF